MFHKQEKEEKKERPDWDEDMYGFGQVGEHWVSYRSEELIRTKVTWRGTARGEAWKRFDFFR